MKKTTTAKTTEKKAASRGLKIVENTQTQEEHAAEYAEFLAWKKSQADAPVPPPIENGDLVYPLSRVRKCRECQADAVWLKSYYKGTWYLVNVKQYLATKEVVVNKTDFHSGTCTARKEAVSVAKGARK